MTTRPLWGNILVRPIPITKTTKNGIALPDNLSDNSKILLGAIISTGTGSLAFDGSPIEIDPSLRNAGTIVAFKRYEAEEFLVEGEKLYLVDQRQIMAIMY